jgi:DNA-binding response OmpR family regulator
MAKILLIEDNDEVRENTAEILTLAGYDVSEASDGAKGVSAAKSNVPDLIICDIMMPEMDGYEVLNHLSHSPTTNRIPFIFLSAKSESSDVRKGMNLGADDYITKPFQEKDLMEAIEARLKKADMLTKAVGTSDEHTITNLAKQSSGMEELMSNTEALTFDKKQRIYEEGGNPNYLYFLKSGRVRTFRVHQDGKEMTSMVLKPGEYFGYVALLEERAYEESAEAMEESEMVAISKDQFSTLLFNDRMVAAFFIRLMSNNIEQKEKQLIDMAYNTVRRRVADALLALHDKFPDTDQGIELGRENLASMAGTSTETAIRMLSEFKHDKLVEIKGRWVKVVEPEKLRKAPY